MAAPQRTVEWAGRAVATSALPSHLTTPMHVIVTLAVVLSGVAVLVLRLHEPDSSHEPIAIGCGLAVGALILYARYALRFAWLSATIVYLTLFWMFHYGLAFTAVLAPDVLASVEDRRMQWLFWPNVRMAMILSLLGAAGFVCGAALASGREGSRPAAPASSDAVLYAGGWLLLLGGTAATAVALAGSGGLGLLSLSYREFRQSVLAPTFLFPAILVSQLGCLLTLCGAAGRQWMAPLALWSLLACVLLLLGLRNEALIPLVSFVIVLALRGVRFNTPALIAVLMLVVVAIPAIRAVRTVGFSNRAQVDLTEVSPLATLTELGGTLRAAKAYVDWIEMGDPYLLGASYWAPLDRQLLARLMPDREQIPFEDDQRMPARDMTIREGAVGASSVGEAYYNFGVLGPVLYLGLVGALFGSVERRTGATPYGAAILSALIFPFYWNIRGQWVSVPAQVGMGLLIVVACYVIRRIIGLPAASPANQRRGMPGPR